MLILRHCLAALPGRAGGQASVPEKYASFLRISHALQLDVFDQPGKNYFFNNLPDVNLYEFSKSFFSPQVNRLYQTCHAGTR